MEQIVLFTVSEVLTIILSQVGVLPSEFSSVLIQLPVVGLFAWYVLYSNKQNREWLDQLLKTQEVRHSHTIELFEKIIERMDIRQNQMADRIEILTQQLAINTSTVNESMRLGELREALEKLADGKE